MDENLKKNILTLLVSSFICVIIFLVIFEIYLRIYYTDDTWSKLITKSRYDSIGYELKPNLNTTFKGNFCKIKETHIFTNEERMRVESVGKKYDINKPANTFRIVGVGDSTMFGWGVEYNETYLSHLERMLNKDSKIKFEVLNFAVPGYNTKSMTETFKIKVLKYKPDLVILGFGINDFNREINYTGVEKLYDPFKSNLLKKIVDKTYLGKIIFSTVYIREKINSFLIFLGFRENVEEIYFFTEGYNMTVQSISELKELTEGNNIQLVVANNEDFPCGQGMSEEIRELLDKFIDFLEQEGIEFIDFSVVYKDCIYEEYYIAKCDPHPTPMVHEKMGTLLYKELINKNLIPLN